MSIEGVPDKEPERQALRSELTEILKKEYGFDKQLASLWLESNFGVTSTKHLTLDQISEAIDRARRESPPVSPDEDESGEIPPF